MDLESERLDAERRSRDRLAAGTLLTVVMISAGALALRLLNLAEWGVWIDELYTVQHAAELAGGFINGRSFAYLPSLIGFELAGIDMASIDPLAIWTWQAAGISEWSLRLPIALLGAASILLLALLSRPSLGSRPMLWLCLLLALSPWHLWMSQVGRFYIQLFVFYNIALLFYYEMTRNGSPWSALAATASVVLAFYTSPIALAITAVFGIDVLVSWLRGRPIGIRPAAWALGLAGLVLCLGGIAFQFADDYQRFEGSEQSALKLIASMGFLIGIPIALTAAFGFWSLVQRAERLALLLAAAGLVPLAAFVVLSLTGNDAHVRYTFMGLFAWLALAAVGIDQLVTALRPRFPAPIAGLPALALLGTYVVDDYIYMVGSGGYQPPWRLAIDYIEAHRQPGEPVLGDHGAFRIAAYYLEDPDVVMTDEAFQPERDLPAYVSGPAWLLQHYGLQGAKGFQRSQAPVIAPGDGRQQPKDLLHLRAYFTNYVPQPHRAVNVFYYDPASPKNQAPRPTPAAALAP